MSSARRIRSRQSVNSLLYSAPLLRILLPYMAGILASRLFLYAHLPAGLRTALLLGAAAAAALLCTLRLDFRHRWTGGLAVAALAFAAGLGMACLGWQKSCPGWPGEERVYRACLLDRPERRARSLSCEARISGYYSPARDSGAAPVFHPAAGKALVYLNPSNPDTTFLQTGQLLLLKARLSAPRNYGNPEEFDYRLFLSARGIGATGYAHRWEALPLRLPPRGLEAKARLLREKLLDRYRKAGFARPGDYGLLAALTLGSKESLTRRQREDYSNAGIGHILVVSGLHVGLVYALARWLLALVFPWRLYYTKQIAGLAAAWGFTFVCGLAPPVLRAAIGLTLFVLATLSGRGHQPMNTLAAAALGLLAWNPLWLFDVGFQLSFAAVAGILLWNEPLFSRLRSSRHPRLDPVARSAAVCLAAQLGVFPLIACHFSTFPTWFLLANLPAVFLCQCIIFAGGLQLLAGSACAFLEKCCIFLLNGLLLLLDELVAFTNSLPLAVIKGLYVPWWEACCVGVFIVVFLRTLQAFLDRRRCRLLPLVLAFGALVACETIKTLAFRPPRAGFYFYAMPSAPAVQCFAPDETPRLWTDTTTAGYPALRNRLQSYWDKIRLPRPQPLSLPYDPARCLLRWQGKTLLRLNGGEQLPDSPEAPLRADFLWITRGNGRPPGRLPQGVEAGHVVLDASLYPRTREQLARECRARGIACTDLAREGAVLFDFSGKAAN